LDGKDYRRDEIEQADASPHQRACQLLIIQDGEVGGTRSGEINGIGDPVSKNQKSG